MKSSIVKRVSPYRLAVYMLIMPLVCLLAGQIITMQSVSGSFAWIFSNAAAAGFLYLFLLFVTAFLYGLFGRLWLASLLPGSVLLFFSVVSYFKTVINGTPLILNDLTLARQFRNVAHFAGGQLHLSFWLVAAILIFFGAHVYLFFIGRKTEQTTSHRIVCAVAGALYLALFFLTPIFSSLAFRIADPEASQEDQANKLGVAMSLYCAKLKTATKASIYDEEDIKAVLDQVDGNTKIQKAADKSVTPTVIFLMSESFFDVTELPGVTFKEDPVSTFHALEASCTSGKFISNTYCGGTAYVEMEVLTGLCSYLLRENDTLTALPDALYGRLPVITDIFKNHGYGTLFLHSYTNALYNRETIYHQFGFDSVLFSDSFPEDAEMRGGYISDMELSKKIISLYEEKSHQKPQVFFCISMENHQPFTVSKYADSEQLVSSEQLDRKGLEILNTYVKGLKDADTALRYLVDYFSGSDAPVMIVFWGDHLPNLSIGNGSTVYSQLGYSSSSVTSDWGPDELAKMLSTDYVIWSNFEETPEADRTESCNFLGLSILNRLGFELTGYYKWLDTHVYPEMLLYRPRLFVTGNDERHRDVPESSDDMIRQYAAVVSDIIYGENELFGAS